MKDYSKSMSNTSIDDENKRNIAYLAAKKHEDKDIHGGFLEYEADRFAANRTSKEAIKRGVKELYKHDRENSKKEIDKIKDKNDRKLKNREYQSDIENDMRRRSKALNDEELTSSDVYK